MDRLLTIPGMTAGRRAARMAALLAETAALRAVRALDEASAGAELAMAEGRDVHEGNLRRTRALSLLERVLWQPLPPEVDVQPLLERCATARLMASPVLREVRTRLAPVRMPAAPARAVAVLAAEMLHVGEAAAPLGSAVVLSFRSELACGFLLLGMRLEGTGGRVALDSAAAAALAGCRRVVRMAGGQIARGGDGDATTVTAVVRLVPAGVRDARG